ncbi:MAG: penicillin-binding protein 2 [Pseudomonadota bacterium]|nr:penicillin-binding protein 2 [Pseudomonadota bacterium]
MKTFYAIRDSEKERNTFSNRVILAGVTMLCLVGLIVGRLVYLQIYNHQHYTTLSEENHIKVRPVAPPRGLIFSQDGVALAENRPSFTLVAVPEKSGNIRNTVNRLAKILDFSEVRQGVLIKRLIEAPKFSTVTLKTELNSKELALFSVNRHKFPGVDIEAGLSRYYPLGEDTAHVLGYVARISERDKEVLEDVNYGATKHIGKTGVEKAREDILHGTVGNQTIEVNAEGRVLRILERTPPVPGQNIVLTLDSKLQQIAAESLRALGGLNGAVVGIEPATGAVLVSVSYPSFDPNKFVNGISQALYAEWSSSSSRPLFDRALQGQYPPGSTVKPLVALSALLNGNNAKKTTKCPGWYSLPGGNHRYRCWEKEGHGVVDLKSAIVRSCDVFFYKISDELGIGKLEDIFAAFGFGKPTGIDLPGERSGLLPSPEWKREAKKLPWYPGETLITGIGQGFLLATPLQLAHATAIISTRGEKHIPYLVQHVESEVGTRQIQPLGFKENRLEISEEAHWEKIIESMVEVVHGPRGTARGSGYGSSVRFAGKTGTSQVFSIGQDEEINDEEVPDHLKDHALFIAFAPTEEPQIALAIVVENGSSGSATAAPIARKIIDGFFINSGINNDG